MDRDRIVAAMERARRQLADDVLAATDPPMSAVIYDHPTAPDAHGFVAIGELRDRPRDRTGIVLLHPATESVRLIWATAA